MALGIHKLTAVQVKALTKPGRYGDGGGLWLQVSQWGTKAWIFRFTLHGKARQMGLGSVKTGKGSTGTFTLESARDRALQARQVVADGIDPIEAKTARRLAAKAEVAKQITFREAAERYIASHRAGWKNEKHGEQWTKTLENYALPVIGTLSVDAVETSHVLRVLEPIWTTKTETASRVRGRIEAVLDWATVREYRTGENPARWRGHLSEVLTAKGKLRKVKHHEAMPYAELPTFMAGLRDEDSISAKALEFTILTAARTGEAIGARWSEIDLASKTWMVPGERVKTGRDHRVPLSERTIDILTDLPRENGNDHVFIGIRPGRGLSNMSMLELLRGMTGNGASVHGFRSSFRDWAAEETNHPREVAEAALAHVVGDASERAYRRGDALQKRRRLMTAWTRYCASKPAKQADNVVAMHGAGT